MNHNTFFPDTQKNLLKLIPMLICLAGITGMSFASVDMADKYRKNGNSMEKATFGNGCFWCTEAVFQRLEGVSEVVSGFSGGHTVDPSYQQVITGETGHAEVVQVTFNPAVISYEVLLEIFFRTHDPTTLNRQGADIGTQYRSIILYHNAQQEQSAREIIKELDNADIWPDPIVTQVVPFEVFYPAEEYHQNYFNRNPELAYCQVVILPKLQKFKKLFKDRLAQ